MKKMFKQKVKHLCGLNFVVSRRPSSKGKWVMTNCPRCNVMFRVYVPRVRAMNIGNDFGKLLPTEPTEEMMAAGDEAILDGLLKAQLGIPYGLHPEHASWNVYQAMVKAAPERPTFPIGQEK